MNKQLLSIIALSVDSRNLTLWQADGSTMVIPQGDARVPRIAAEAKSLGLKPGMTIEVDITIEDALRQEYLDAEKGTGGLVKFFRIAKKKLTEFFNDDSEVYVPIIPAMELGAKPNEYNKLIEDAAAKSVAILECSPKASEPEVTVSHKSYGVQSVWVTKVFDNGTRVPVIKAIREFMKLGLKEAVELLNQELPIRLVNRLSLTQAEEFTKRLNDTNGVIAEFMVDSKVPEAVKAVAPTNTEKLNAASERLQAMGAVDTQSSEFHKDLTDEETIIAVVNDKVVPDVQNLQRQLRQSAKLQDYKGFTRFLERLSAVIDKRLHSVEDLMKFMEKGDLPIADDGSIVIFKRLNSKPGAKHITGDVFVDCHSGQIEQCVGMKVAVKEALVDQNRRKDCSNGLHVASLQYIRNFSGDVTIIGKVAPEDVFAVPEYDSTKMRVSAYHIVAKLPENVRNHVNGGGAISGVEGGTEILNMVLSGNHPSPSQHVLVGGHRGSNLTYTRLTAGMDNQESNSETTSASKQKTALDMHESLEKPVNVAPPVKAVDVKSQPKKATIVETIADLWQQFNDAQTSGEAIRLADEMIAIKGKCKKPWSVLGMSPDMVQRLVDARSAKAKPVAEPVKETKAKAKVAKSGSSKNADIIRGYLNDSGMSDYAKAHAIHDLKRAAKKSYGALGLTIDECRAIDKLQHHLK
jgi:ribosomal protein L7/L12